MPTSLRPRRATRRLPLVRSNGPVAWLLARMASVKIPGPVSSSVYVGSAGRVAAGNLNFATMASSVALPSVQSKITN